MAQKGIRDYRCKIISIEDHPKLKTKKRLNVEIDDGRGEPYQRFFSVSKNAQVITIEMLAEMLSQEDLSRPKDPFEQLGLAVVDETVFEVRQESI